MKVLEDLNSGKKFGKEIRRERSSRKPDISCINFGFTNLYMYFERYPRNQVIGRDRNE